MRRSGVRLPSAPPNSPINSRGCLVVGGLSFWPAQSRYHIDTGPRDFARIGGGGIGQARFFMTSLAVGGRIGLSRKKVTVSCMDKRAPPVAVLAAAALVFMAPGVSAQPAQPAHNRWAGITLDPTGWVNMGGDGDHWVFYRLPVSKPPEALPRIWVRWEYSTPRTTIDPAWRSSLALEEVDCAQGRSRYLQMMTYPNNNMNGAVGWTSS